MKLLSKTILLIVTVCIIIFMIGNIVFFHISKQMINRHINKELIGQMHKVVQQMRVHKGDLNNAFFFNELEIKPIPLNYYKKPSFFDTVIYSKIQKRYIPHRTLQFSMKNNNKNRLITIYKSLVPSDKLIERITLASILMVVVFIIMIYILNRYVFASVWADFFVSLKRVKQHDIKSKSYLNLGTSEIEEFNKLNLILTSMVNRIQKDYLNLKELTANTSHEIQTPLAIIKNKSEILMQSKTMDKKAMENISVILNTVERLAKLNKSLLLITKIDNNQFDDSENICLKSAIEKHLQNFEFLLQTGNFQIERELAPLEININATLLDILLTNLIKNALVHSNAGSHILIGINGSKLTVSNSGNEFPFAPELLFKRFVKGTGGDHSTGLGLEIVKKISDFYSIPVDYYYQDASHNFCVDFSTLCIK